MELNSWSLCKDSKNSPDFLSHEKKYMKKDLRNTQNASVMHNATMHTFNNDDIFSGNISLNIYWWWTNTTAKIDFDSLMKIKFYGVALLNRGTFLNATDLWFFSSTTIAESVGKYDRATRHVNKFISTDLVDTLHASDSTSTIAPRIYILTAAAAVASARGRESKQVTGFTPNRLPHSIQAIEEWEWKRERRPYYTFIV